MPLKTNHIRTAFILFPGHLRLLSYTHSWQVVRGKSNRKNWEDIQSGLCWWCWWYCMEGPWQYSDRGCDWRMGCRRTCSFYYQPIPFCRDLH